MFMDGPEPRGAGAGREGIEILRVSEVSEIIREVLDDTRLLDIWVRGELSNYKHHSSGHRYFSLSDRLSDGNPALINGVMWSRDARGLAFEPAAGMDVIAFGYIGLYAPQGKYQFYARDMRPAGEGEKHLLVAKWRRELEAAGYFAPERKKPLPAFPVRVGVVTSGTGAVFHDIKNVISRRFPLELVLSPTAVQGEGAEREIADAIRRVDGKVDVIILARGGGSFDDLFPFNHPDVARAIGACRSPVVSAVGHEVDTTLADLAADLRAPTPSAAAELVVPDRTDLFEGLVRERKRMGAALYNRLERAALEITGYRDRLHPRRLIARVADRREETSDLVTRLSIATATQIRERNLVLGGLKAALEGRNPLALLARGYSVAERDGVVVKSAVEISAGDRLRLRFSDGNGRVVVEGVEIGKKI